MNSGDFILGSTDEPGRASRGVKPLRSAARQGGAGQFNSMSTGGFDMNVEFLIIGDKKYSREQVFAAYLKAESGAELTREEYDLAACWVMHPLINTMPPETKYASLAHLMRNRDKAKNLISREPTPGAEVSG